MQEINFLARWITERELLGNFRRSRDADAPCEERSLNASTYILVFLAERRSIGVDRISARRKYLCLELEGQEETCVEQMYLCCKSSSSISASRSTCLHNQIRRIAFAEDGSYFVTVGNRHVKFWYLISTASVRFVVLSLIEPSNLSSMIAGSRSTSRSLCHSG